MAGAVKKQSGIKSRPTQKGDELKALEKKWGKETLMVNGWTAIPNILLERQQALGIDAIKLNILLVLLMHWWTKPDMPFPGKTKISEFVGRDTSTVQKHIKQMEQQGLIERKTRFLAAGGQTSNEYDLSGLIAKLHEFAASGLEVKRTRKEEDGRKRRGRTT